MYKYMCISLPINMAIFLNYSSIAQARSFMCSILFLRTISFARAIKFIYSLFLLLYRFLAFHVHPFWVQLLYFLSLNLSGSLALMFLSPSNPSFKPGYVDMLYMSTSALTVSGLNSVELENFSSAQIVVLTLLMFMGGEVFTSLLALLSRILKYNKPASTETTRVEALNHLEAGHAAFGLGDPPTDTKDIAYNSIQYLFCIIFSYVLLIHVSGSVFVLLNVSLVSSARDTLKGRGINRVLFSISLTVSSFANAGLVPTNENMIIFKKNTLLLLIIIPQVLAGNTLYPLFLRLVVWLLRKITEKQEFDYMMMNCERAKYSALMPSLRIACLAITVIAFIVAQVLLFCLLDWNAAVLDGLNSYQKIVNSLFMAVNSRHAGEGSVDLSITSPAVLILYIIMMYLPGWTSYVPFEEEERSTPRDESQRKKGRPFVQKYILSQLSCIAIFVMVICITERKKLSNDPLNFPVLNIVLEIVSAYGNVGFSTGYSCGRMLVPDENCKDKWISLSGKWSDKGKLVLVFVLLFGRLKKFTMDAGRAWNLS